jgi:hypothetical protein
VVKCAVIFDQEVGIESHNDWLARWPLKRADADA